MSGTGWEISGPTIREQLKAEAAAQGAAEGEARGLRIALQRVLETRFGAIPGEIAAAITSTDAGRRDRWFTRTLAAAALAETGIAVDATF